MYEIEAKVHTIEASDHQASLNHFEDTNPHQLHLQVIRIHLIEVKHVKILSRVQVDLILQETCSFFKLVVVLLLFVNFHSYL